MKNTFTKRFKKLIIWLVTLFVILFVFRLLYGYTKTFNNTTSNDIQYFEAFSSLKKNYATKKYQVQSSSTAQFVDQKYEKIAEVKTKSADFEKEEKASRKMVKKYDALIQFEQKSGNKGFRKLNLVIGVPPQNFDSLYKELITLGNIQVKQITKKDKTNEYKELNAKKKSLEKIRNSLIELKSKGGDISEYIGLENRILEIEQELQGLGVSLGDFDDENEFCTVKFSLLEGKEIRIGTMQRIKVALEWTVKIYLKIMITFFFLSLFAYILLHIIDKLKIFEKLITKE